jgi:hypothetical protein
MDSVDELIARQRRAPGELFDVSGRRLGAVVEAGELGCGGSSLIARATGLSLDTMSRGPEELAGLDTMPQGRIRAEGVGRKPLTDKDPLFLEGRKRLVIPTTRGDLQSPLRWTCESIG